MKIYKGLETEFNCKNPVVTIGTFDGLHIGHQKIIERVREEAQKINGESVLLTFYPHPRSVIESERPISLLQAHEDKLVELEALGLQHLIILPFTSELSTMSAYNFIKDILVAHINLKKIVLGYDHHFGNNREGNIEFLNKHAQSMGFDVIEIPAKEIDEIKISSTKIREAIRNGEIEKASKFLGKPYEITGTVIKGNQLGRTIGYPTANINPIESLQLLPKIGVYAVKIKVLHQIYFGMLNIGLRPTVEENGQMKLEVHIFDFSEHLYGEKIQVHLYERIRNEQNFASIEALKAQIEEDEIITRSYFMHLD